MEEWLPCVPCAGSGRVMIDGLRDQCDECCGLGGHEVTPSITDGGLAGMLAKSMVAREGEIARLKGALRRVADLRGYVDPQHNMAVIRRAVAIAKDALEADEKPKGERK